jgi:phosphoribosylformylglycinamidine synthase
MCSTFGGHIILDAVPLRETGMTPREILVSESQERMVFEVAPDHVDDLLEVAEKYDLNASVIGEVTEEAKYVVEWRGDIVADIPIKLLTEGAPLCTPERQKQTERQETLAIPELTLEEKASRVLASINVASKDWVFTQYDHEVQTRTVVKPGRGAAVLAIDDHSGIALSSGCNAAQVAVDPFKGAASTVFANAMKVAVKGATPVALVNCLNFGNPDKGEIYGQLERAVAGLSHAARTLNIPIVGGNVSLYNESEEFQTAIIPTPSIGLVARLRDVSKVPAAVFVRGGDAIILVGETYAEYGGSEFSEIFEIGGTAPLPRAEIKSTTEALAGAVDSGTVSAAIDVARGGILCALAHMCAHHGATVDVSRCLANENELFSETSGRAILTVACSDLNSTLASLQERSVSAIAIGIVGGETLSITIGKKKLVLSLKSIKRSLDALNEIMLA